MVHSAIANDFNKLQEDRAFAYDSYVALTQRVTHAANRAGAQIIYVSSGWVMDGTTHMTPESNPGNPVNFYGVLKALSEQVIRDLAPETGAIARIEGVMGIHQTQSVGPRTQDVGFGYFVTSPLGDEVETDVDAQIRRLQEEVRVLRMERDILKKAAAFFAKESA